MVAVVRCGTRQWINLINEAVPIDAACRAVVPTVRIDNDPNGVAPWLTLDVVVLRGTDQCAIVVGEFVEWPTGGKYRSVRVLGGCDWERAAIATDHIWHRLGGWRLVSRSCGGDGRQQEGEREEELQECSHVSPLLLSVWGESPSVS